MENYELIAKYIPSEDLRNIFLQHQGSEHYRLLSRMSLNYNDTVLYDIGTHRGLSALALSLNQSNRVITYDIVYIVEIERPENVEIRIGNFYNDSELLNSPLIMFDIDPHNGQDEREFVDYLERKSYKGTVVFDDIHLNEGMNSFWESIKQEKHDVTCDGHFSGTGIVIFK